MPRKRKRSRSAARGGRSRSATAPKRAVTESASAPTSKRAKAEPASAPTSKRAKAEPASAPTSKRAEAEPASAPTSKRAEAEPPSAPASKRPASGPAGAPARNRTTAGAGMPGHRFLSLDNWILGLAGLGVLLTGYLTLVAWLGEHPAYCGAESECDLVQSSRWSTLFGMPMSLWGLLTYALLAVLAWRLRSRAPAWRATLLVAGVGAGVSWFLTLVSVFQIEATCGYCLASFVLMNVLLVLVLLRRPPRMPEHAWSKALPLPVGAVVVVVLGLQLHFSGVFDPAAGPEDPRLKALATHLRDSGARFYGAYWCPACQEQKELFTASVDRLPYVECTPQGRGGPRAVDCLTRNIEQYPTWIIDGQRHTGVVSVERLGRLSSFDRDALAQEAVPER